MTILNVRTIFEKSQREFWRTSSLMFSFSARLEVFRVACLSSRLLQTSSQDMAEKLVQLVATVPTGLEPWSVKECGGMPECISVKHNRDGKIDLTCREADVKAVSYERKGPS